MGKDIMALLVVRVASLLSIAGHLSGAVTQQVVTNPKLQKGLCSNSSVCPLKTYCRQTSDCSANEYCHKFHGFCLMNPEPITMQPPRTSAAQCGTNSDCKSKEYCHDIWKICLTVKIVIADHVTTTQRPSWFCNTSQDCRIEQVCHKNFQMCFTQLRVSAVRRREVSPRPRCHKDCGPGYYCHDYFLVCLPEAGYSVTSYKHDPSKRNICARDSECGIEMRCHSLWKLCFTPSKRQVVQTPDASTRKRRQCRLDSDCERGHFCHRIPSKVVTSRHRREVQRSVCKPISDKDALDQPKARPQCKTSADCGPNKCCLPELRICQPYQLPGGICLVEKATFVCPCTLSSYCVDRGKVVSPREFIHKLQLLWPAVDHVMRQYRKRKYKVGKCLPRLLG